MITLTEEEIEKYQQQLTSILGYVQKVSEIDTTENEYVSQVDMTNVTREDITAPSLSQDLAIQNRKESAVQGAFTINTVIPTEE